MPGVPIAALAGTIVVEGAFETVTGLALGAWATSAGIGNAGGGPPWVPIIVFGAVTTALSFHPRINRWIMARLREAARGVALLTDPKRYARTVLPWDVVSRVLRFGSMACFLAAFSLPTTLAAVAFLVFAQGSGRIVPAPGAAAGVSGAVFVVGFTPVTGLTANTGLLTALAIGVPALLTVVGVDALRRCSPSGSSGRPARVGRGASCAGAATRSPAALPPQRRRRRRPRRRPRTPERQAGAAPVRAPVHRAARARSPGVSP
jgi:hypothetical protein